MAEVSEVSSQLTNQLHSAQDPCPLNLTYYLQILWVSIHRDIHYMECGHVRTYIAAGSALADPGSERLGQQSRPWLGHRVIGTRKEAWVDGSVSGLVG